MQLILKPPKYGNINLQLEAWENDRVTVSRVQCLSPVVWSEGSRNHLISHTLHRPPESNTHKWFNFDDGEITEAKMDNNELYKCVISVVCERQCLCIIMHMLDIESKCVQTQSVINLRIIEVLYCTPYPYT